jgi:hypothetical protein
MNLVSSSARPLNHGRNRIRSAPAWPSQRRSVPGLSGDISSRCILVEKHQKEKQRRAHGSRTIRVRESAALDALGSVGLMGFALVERRLLCNPLGALMTAAPVWLIVWSLLWRVHRII